MGFRYYASVKFPAWALEIEEIKSECENKKYTEFENDGSVVMVADDQANYGTMDITALLDEHHVPYDHYHGDGDSADNIGTYHVRFAKGAEAVANTLTNEPLCTEHWEAEADNTSHYASKWLKLLNENKLDELRASLEEHAPTYKPIDECERPTELATA